MSSTYRELWDRLGHRPTVEEQWAFIREAMRRERMEDGYDVPQLLADNPALANDGASPLSSTSSPTLTRPSK